MSGWNFDEALKPVIEQQRRWFALGKKHRDEGLPRDHTGIPQTPGGKFLKVYVEAYNAGYDMTPQEERERAEFARVDAYLNQLPTRSLTNSDL